MRKFIAISFLAIFATSAQAEEVKVYGLDVGCYQHCLEQGGMSPVCQRQCSF